VLLVLLALGSLLVEVRRAAVDMGRSVPERRSGGGGRAG